ncbi:MAG TPA: type II toxin-antitoxin system HicB family antitoxin, partial [Methanothrix soehngenii]|nr:type II toxin-antitoxin system HicB family antitoxin [Methanothrix soehngenii]
IPYWNGIYMFSEYIRAALSQAKYESLEDGSYMATVAGLPGVIATGDTIEKCRDDLIEVIEESVAIRLLHESKNIEEADK